MKKKIVLGVVALLVLMQLIPVKRTNPPVTADFDGPAAVHAVLARSCYDCHSNETRWPWYSRVAPMKFLVGHDVSEGRSKLNFSDWGTYDQAKRAKLGGEIIEETEKSDMPPFQYLLIHRDARLTAGDLRTLRAWQD